MSESETLRRPAGAIEGISRLLRLVVLILMVLLPAAAIYAFVVGGVTSERDMRMLAYAPGDRVFTFNAPFPQSMPLPPVPPIPMTPGVPLTLPVPPPEAFRAGPGRVITTECSESNGVRTCTTTERALQPGEQLAPPPAPGGGGEVLPTPTPAPAAYEPAVFQPAQPGPFSILYGVAATDAAAAAPAYGSATWEAARPVPGAWAQRIPPQGGPFGVAIALSVVSLLATIGILYGLERLLQAFERGSVFSAQTVRGLQIVGALVALTAFVPQLDFLAVVQNAALSLANGGPAQPLAVAMPDSINVPLLLAGIFTMLIARVVSEAVWLADEVRATV